MISLLFSTVMVGWQTGLHALSDPQLWSSLALFVLEAAARSLFLGVAVALGLRLFGVRNVIAQKTAWILVLAAAIAMPAAVPLLRAAAWFPRQATLVLPLTRLAPFSTANALSADAQATGRETSGPALGSEYTFESAPSSAPAPLETSAGSEEDTTDPQPTSDVPLASAPQNPIAPAAPHLPRGFSIRQIAALAYLLVCGSLLSRLSLSVWAAYRLWKSSEPVSIEDGTPAPQRIPVRTSERITSPVTIASGIVLPVDFETWDPEKLRIVLAHEKAHVRQGDFYLQAAASLYAAIIWFSPLGWWLRRRLSELGEAISDRAGIREAASRTSYARILLQFAAMPHRAQVGVAMARKGSFSNRMERLLNEANFRQAFAEGRTRIAAAVLLVAAAVFASTAMLRVEASSHPASSLSDSSLANASLSATAQQEQQEPTTGQSHPESAPDVVTPSPASVPSKPAPAQVPAPPAPASSDSFDTQEPPPAAPQAPVAPVSPHPSPAAAPEPPEPAVLPTFPTPPPSLSFRGEHPSIRFAPQAADGSGFARNFSRDSAGRGYSYSYSSNGNSYALVNRNGKGDVHFSGNWCDGTKADLDKARRMAHGDFLWFSRGGKAYVVDDPAVVASIQEMYRPMEELGRRQEELGKQQEDLGRQQEELGRRQEQVTVPAPDVSKEVAALNAQLAKLEALRGKNVTQDQLADLQSKLGDLQGKLGDLQGRMGGRIGELGVEQGRLGAKQGALGAEQGRLGAEQGRLAREADRKVKSLIEQSLSNGKARPVQ